MSRTSAMLWNLASFAFNLFISIYFDLPFNLFCAGFSFAITLNLLLKE